MPNTDKTILLPQLQRYDQKIKGWADAKFLTKADTPSLPKATATTLGGVKVGSGLNVTDDGILSAEDDIVFTWDFDTSAFSCNKTFAEVKKIITTGVRRTATVNGLLENFSITLLVGAANDDGVMFFGTAPGDALGSGMLGSRTNETITYLFQKGLAIMYASNGQIQMTEDLSNLNTNMSFDFKNTTFQYDQYNSFDLKDGGITSAKLANGAVTSTKIASGAVTSDKITNGAVSSVKIASNAVTADKIADGAVTSTKLANNAVTTDKIADSAIRSTKLAVNSVTTDKIKDGAITKAKLASDVGAGGDDVVTITFDGTTADKTWDEVDALYKAGKRLQVLSTEWGDEYILPLVSVMNNGNNLYNFSAHYTNGRRAEVNFWHDPSIPDSSHQKEIFSEISDYPAASKTSLGVVKVGDGLSITSDGTLKASGAGGGGSIFNLGALSKGTLLSIVSFDCGNFIMYLVSFNIEPSPSGNQISYNLHGTDLLISPKSTGTVHIVPPSIKPGFYSYTLTWFQPKSASAKAALATLLPVQDECEQMEAEAAKLEQDWIDNPDDMVAVDGNGVPITIATKKTELEKKQAELEKLREDYFSKLGDWKNEVQE